MLEMQKGNKNICMAGQPREGNLSFDNLVFPTIINIKSCLPSLYFLRGFDVPCNTSWSLTCSSPAPSATISTITFPNATVSSQPACRTDFMLAGAWRRRDPVLEETTRNLRVKHHQRFDQMGSLLPTNHFFRKDVEEGMSNNLKARFISLYFKIWGKCWWCQHTEYANDQCLNQMFGRGTNLYYAYYGECPFLG